MCLPDPVAAALAGLEIKAASHGNLGLSGDLKLS